MNESDILKHVARNDWAKATKIYMNDPESRKARIPGTGDTALHVAVAVSIDRSNHVKIMASVAGSRVLAMGNRQGNTPLHLAATLENPRICKWIAKDDASLIGARNDYGETPLFCAVTKGRTHAFLYLHHFCKDKPGCQQYGYYRRNNGDTILHSAISERHFDLAYIIINEYPKLVHRVNEDGLSPLHLLPTKFADPSGLQVLGIHKLLYRCVRVRKLEQLPDLAKERPDPLFDWKITEMHRDYFATNFCSCLYDGFDKIRRLACCLKNQRDEAITNGQMDHREHPQDEEAANGQVNRDDQQDGQAANMQVEPGKNQQNEEASKNQDRKEIGQQYEEATKEQAENQENLQQVGETSSNEQGLKRGGREVYNAICRCVSCSIVSLLCILYNLAKLLSVAFKMAKYVIGFEEYIFLKRVKEKSIWSMEVMNKLVVCTSEYPYQQGGMRPDVYEYLVELFPRAAIEMVEAPILMAAKHGVVEMVLHILEVHPDAIFDVNAENKNIAMLAAEHRQPHLYEVLLRDWGITKTIFGHVDKDGNSLLHIAANLVSAADQQQFWHIPGPALQMHMEVKWYKFVPHSMSPHFFNRYNNARKTPDEIFQESHRHLIEEGRQWLTSTSQSCSVVAALIATVAFATSATVPGGLKQDNGAPTLEHKPVFIISAASSLIALSSSMISVVLILGILTSSFKLRDFGRDLPNKLLLGLISLLISIVSMLVSFYAGHFFVLKEEFAHSATVMYTSLCFPLVFLVISKFPLDFNIVSTTLSKKPIK